MTLTSTLLIAVLSVFVILNEITFFIALEFLVQQYKVQKFYEEFQRKQEKSSKKSEKRMLGMTYARSATPPI